MNRRSFDAGRFVRAQAGTDFEYRYFLPTLLPDDFGLLSADLTVLLEDATQRLGELNAYAQLIPDIDYFIQMHEVKEATESSRIEGTRTSVDEAVLPEMEIAPERRDDWQEVQNYIKAMNFAIERLDSLPLATRLIKETHAVLLEGVRGEHKTPGELRRSQNWIGGATIRDARFVPPVHTELDRYLDNLDHYWNDRALTTPVLIKAAISHYQFETVHPFLDGNGRLGRLMIVLYLISKKRLSKPVLYLSDYFSKYREEYYEALDAVRYRGDMEHWLRFFLVAVKETAELSCATLRRIIELRERDSKKIIQESRRVASNTKLLNALYRQPVTSVVETVMLLGVTRQTASQNIKDLVNLGILIPKTRTVAGRSYVYQGYIDLFG